MTRNHYPLFLTSIFVAAGVTVASMGSPVSAQSRPARRVTQTQPERSLVGVRLGRSFNDVLRLYKAPNQVQTVAVAQPADALPGLGGGAAGGMMGYGADAGMGMGSGAMGMGSGGMGSGGMGMYGGMGAMGGGPSMGSFGAPGGAFGGGSPFGSAGAGPGMGSFGAPGGLPGVASGDLDSGEGGYGSMMGSGMMGSGMMGPGMGSGMMGYGAEAGGSMGLPGAGGPEYSNAILWIYNRPGNVRLEFLINEDGRVAQISAAAPAGKSYPSAKTSKGVRLGSSMQQVMGAYGNPERYRMIPGGRFLELYYTKANHAAFTFDTTKQMKVVRITIALAD